MISTVPGTQTVLLTAKKSSSNLQFARLSVPGRVITVPHDCQGNMIIPGGYYSPRQSRLHKTVNPRQLLAQRSSTVRQDCQSPEIAGSKNKYCTVRHNLTILGNCCSYRSSCGQENCAWPNPRCCPIMQNCLNPRTSTGFHELW